MKKLYFLFALLFLFSIFSSIYAMQEQNLRSLVEKVLEKQTQTKTGKEVLAEVKSLFLACEQSQMLGLVDMLLLKFENYLFRSV